MRFENRCLRSDGTVVWLDWTMVADHGVIYGAARDITERRRQEHELRVLADQQASLRRVATLVARGVAPSEVFSAVAVELAGVLECTNPACSATNTMAAVYCLRPVRTPAG